MKVGIFAVIPAEVRYDNQLSDKSKLLYAEIAAAANTWGVTEDDNHYFAAALKVDRRTITRCLGQLIDNGHVMRLSEKGRRKLKIVLKGIPIPQEKEVEVVTSVDRDELDQGYEKLIGFWEQLRKTELDDRESYFPIIRERLKVFNEVEICKALDARQRFLNQSAWHRLPENKAAADDIMAVICDDDTVLNWLNSSPAAV